MFDITSIHIRYHYR